jgi:hypothetical protein
VLESLGASLGTAMVTLSVILIAIAVTAYVVGKRKEKKAKTA